jgi:6-phosphofructokinase 1
MKRIGILTAGGDTPALNATLFGAVERANRLGVEVVGLLDGFGGLLDERVPHLVLNPLFATILELDPCRGGTILGASRTYIATDAEEALAAVAGRLQQLQIEGLVCVGGDGTVNGMQSLCDLFPCVLAPKTIDNDLGLNHPHDKQETEGETGDALNLEAIVNYATPGYATAVFVVTQGIRRIRTTAESHRRIAIIEVMGRQSGFIALGSAYGQPDLILIPESPLEFSALERRVRELYEHQEHVVIVVGEGVVDPEGRRLGEVTSSLDPAGNMKFSGAAEALKQMLVDAFGDDFFRAREAHHSADAAIFTRKVGHTQRGGRPIRFDRFHATQLGGKAVELLVEGGNNLVATLQWTRLRGFELDAVPAVTFRDEQGEIPPRLVHRSLYDAQKFQPSPLGVNYLQPIFTDAVGPGDVECLRTGLFQAGHLATAYESVNVGIRKRIRYLDDIP